jgi:hypothetical protein
LKRVAQFLCFNYFAYCVIIIDIMSKRKGKDSTSEMLTAARDTRVAVKLLEQHERYIALLRHANRIRVNSGLPDKLGEVIKAAESEFTSLRQKASGRVEPRRRAHKTDPDPSNSVTVYIDECGSHTLSIGEPFNAFVLGAVVIRDKHYDQLDNQ